MKNKLFKLREKAGLSQKELAKKMQVSQQTISGWETDRSMPKPFQLSMLEELFKTPKEEIFFGSFNYKMELNDSIKQKA